MQIIEPAGILLFGLMIGIIVMGMYMPIFDLPIDVMRHDAAF